MYMNMQHINNKWEPTSVLFGISGNASGIFSWPEASSKTWFSVGDRIALGGLKLTSANCWLGRTERFDSLGSRQKPVGMSGISSGLLLGFCLTCWLNLILTRSNGKGFQDTRVETDGDSDSQMPGWLISCELTQSGTYSMDNQQHSSKKQHQRSITLLSLSIHLGNTNQCNCIRSNPPFTAQMSTHEQVREQQLWAKDLF